MRLFLFFILIFLAACSPNIQGETDASFHASGTMNADFTSGALLGKMQDGTVNLNFFTFGEKGIGISVILPSEMQSGTYEVNASAIKAGFYRNGEPYHYTLQSGSITLDRIYEYIDLTRYPVYSGTFDLTFTDGDGELHLKATFENVREWRGLYPPVR